MNMLAEHSLPAPSRAIRAEASAWIAKLYGAERSPALEADFRSWLQAASEHARAFEMITGVWEDMSQVSIGGMPRLAPRGLLKGPPRWRRPAVAMAAGLLAALALFWTLQDKV